MDCAGLVLNFVRNGLFLTIHGVKTPILSIIPGISLRGWSYREWD